MGFRVVDRVSERLGCLLRKPFLRRYLLGKSVVDGNSILLVKPLTYMNRSGEVIGPLLAATGCTLADLLVVCDTLDLPVGACRLKTRGSSAGHNGLGSIIAHTGSQDFRRLYVGIGRPTENSVVEYVLSAPDETEESRLAVAVDRAADTVVDLLTRPVDRVMNEINQRET